MLTRLRRDFADTPGQFWLMFFGMILATTGTTMIWPFLLIFASEKLNLPLVAVASLMAINAGTGLVSAIVAGPIIDRLGRKGMMILGLAGAGLGYFFLSKAETYTMFALVLGGMGFFSPLYNVGTDAMLADLFSMERRAEAFALIRMARNIGVATGPILGGFVLARSYNLGMYGAAGGLLFYGLMLLIFAKETLPQQNGEVEKTSLRAQMQGYWAALQDKPFMGLIGAFTLVQMIAVLVWVMLSVYVKTNFGIDERLYGWLPTTNALMVVFFQVIITRNTKKYPPLAVMSWGTIFYILAPLIIAISSHFWGFWLGMVVLTLGELIVVPRTSAYAANLAPVDKRGRYMSLYGLTWNVAAGIAPVVGGFLSDQVSPRAPWIGGVAIGFLTVLAFRALKQRHSGEEIIIS